MMPIQLFLTKGVGFHRDQLISFEAALRDAEIANYNLVTVSSILPPKCRIIKKEEGIKLLKPGQIVHVVLARNAVKEGRRLISAAIGVAIPKDDMIHGYLSELHAEGLNEEESRDWAEDRAAELLASTLGIPFDGEKAWDKEKEIFKIGKRAVRTKSICQSVVCRKGVWTSVVAAAVFIL